MRIGIDLMGSDSSPLILFEAVIEASSRLGPDVTLVVFTTRSILDQILVHEPWKKPLTDAFDRIAFQVVQEVIEMKDDPLEVIRKKKGSSMVAGMRLLRKRLLDGFVTAGNTGALVAYATLFLPKLPGIRRAALLAVLPTAKGSVAVIDVGGNVYAKADHLVQFAQIGAAYQRCCNNIDIPSIGLLNVGVESKKGTSEVKQAYQLLENLVSHQPHLRFVGNIEGREVFQGHVDVLVTDGFTGNVFLKTSEGVSLFIFDILKKSIKSDAPPSMLASLQQMQGRFHYEEYAGAVVCGIDCVAVKCHGHSSAKGMFNAIKGTYTLIKERFISRLKEQLTVK